MIATNPIHLPFRGAPWLMVRGSWAGSWAESNANNAEITQSVVWLPVHMGNVGSMRYEKPVANFLAFIKLAAIRPWLGVFKSTS